MLEETVDDGVSLVRTQYTIGDDVLTQTKSTWDDSGGVWDADADDDGVDDTQYLLYDGHGSTRQLVDNDGAVVNDPARGGLQSYSYGKN